MSRTASLLALLGLAGLASSAAFAQDNTAAGLFTEARQLPLVSQSLTVQVRGDDATVHITQVFANDGGPLGQADLLTYLPQGASVDAFGFWTQDRYLEAGLKEREEAHAAHAAAAAEGRATAILDTEGSLSRFSVFPVEGGSLKQVETTLSVPVEVEGGRRELRLPVDRFLGQAGPTSTVTVDIRTDRPLAELGLSPSGAEGTQAHILARDTQSALLVTTTRQPLVLHWQEEAPPLDLLAQLVDTPDGAALGLRIGLNDSGLSGSGLSDSGLSGSGLSGSGLNRPDPDGVQRLVLLVDGSTSMVRRRGAIAQVMERIQDDARVPFLARTIVDGHSLTGLDLDAGHRTTWTELKAAVAAEGCGPTVRCVVLTDAQLPDLAQAEGSPAELLVLADPQEATFFASNLPPRAAVYQPGVEALARLRSQVDEAVLPVLDITELRLNRTSVLPLGHGPWRVAEGGLLRLHAFVDAKPGDTLELYGSLGGQPITRSLVLGEAGEGGEGGLRLRRAAYRDLLAELLRGWKDQPDETAQQRIVELSLREGIPTAFTSLQVDDPELSLASIKPGDPVLRVPASPGVTDVVAWYPFGERRRLVRDPGGDGDFSDRFLVPRFWEERAYRVEVFSRRADGRVEQKSTWYSLDEAAPQVGLHLDGGRLRVDTGAATPDIGAVEIHGPASVRRLGLDTDSPLALAQDWSVPVAELPEAFTVVVRDRAGNTTRLPVTLTDGALGVQPASRVMSAAPVLPMEHPDMQAGAGPMRVEGARTVVHLARRSLSFDSQELHLRSLRLTAALDLGDELYLGTQGGDLLQVRCTAGSCAATALDTGAPEHPITGLAALSGGRVLVGVLGAGLREIAADRVGPSPLRVGSRFITGVGAAPGGDLLVGTATNGLWRIVDGRPIRTRFPHDHVAALHMPGDPLAARPVPDVTVDSGFGRFLRLSRDRFEWQDPGLNELGTGSSDLVDLCAVGDTIYAAGFDSGLWRLGPEGELGPVSLRLSPDEARINALAFFDGALWLGTEGGLLALDTDHPEAGVRRVLPGAVHDLDAGTHGLAVASSKGLFVVDGAGARRVDLAGPLSRPLVGSGRFLSVAWHQGALYAGSLDGLVRLDAAGSPVAEAAAVPVPITVADGLGAGWITALRSDGDRLWVGTYADGLWTIRRGRVQPVAELAGQWVPPHALAALGDELWVGGLGMPAVRIDRDGKAVAMDLPVRDVNAALPGPDGGMLLATSDGLVRLPPQGVARR